MIDFLVHSIPHYSDMRLIFFIFLLFISIALRSQVIRGDTTQHRIALVLTGDEFGDGASFIRKALKKNEVKASFFLTGNFYRIDTLHETIQQLINDGHYLGSHSDKHLLYCDWKNRDSLLVTKPQFDADLSQSYKELASFGITKFKAHYFLPPYEWYNDSIVQWTKENGLQLVCFTPGTRSTADYTYPEMGTRYVSSNVIYNSIIDYEKSAPSGLNGFILLVHIGTDPRRTDKFYFLLPKLITQLKLLNYEFARIDELLQ